MPCTFSLHRRSYIPRSPLALALIASSGNSPLLPWRGFAFGSLAKVTLQSPAIASCAWSLVRLRNQPSRLLLMALFRHLVRARLFCEFHVLCGFLQEFFFCGHGLPFKLALGQKCHLRCFAKCQFFGLHRTPMKELRKVAGCLVLCRWRLLALKRPLQAQVDFQA